MVWVHTFKLDSMTNWQILSKNAPLPFTTCEKCLYTVNLIIKKPIYNTEGIDNNYLNK